MEESLQVCFAEGIPELIIPPALLDLHSFSGVPFHGAVSDSKPE